MSIVETDVLVVGAGPAGATASLALGNYGIRNICLSKYSSPSQAPRAHITNQRTMEVLRHFGLEQQANALATPNDLMGNEVYCTSLTGFEIGRLKAWHTHPTFQAQHDLASPCSMVDLPQDLLEPILVAGAMRAGSHVRFDTELVDFVQDDSGVTAELKDRLTGVRSQVRARYMIGADGANSRIVEKLGLPLEGVVGMAGNFGIRFKADLSRFVAHRSGVLYWIIQPGRGIGGYPIAGLRMVRAWDRWVTTWAHDISLPAPDISNEAAIAIVHRIIGDSTVHVEIEGTHVWSMNRVRAKAYGVGRTFCVGDAVHRHPPMNGLGSNTSVQDSFNLAWKLAMVVRGDAGEALLDSYEQERLPIGQEVVRRATDNFRYFAPVAKAAGFDPIEQTPEQFTTLADRLADPTPEGQARRLQLRKAIANAVSCSSALGGEHNQFYRSSAVIADGRDLTVDNPDLEVVLGMESGRRLPHVWLTREQHRVSSLDVCAQGQFTLITGISDNSWARAAQHVHAALNIPLDVVSIGPGQIYEDAYGDFMRVCLPDETGAILVRPDLFVGWHSVGLPDDAAAELEAVLRQVLARAVGSSDHRAQSDTRANAIIVPEAAVTAR